MAADFISPHIVLHVNDQQADEEYFIRYNITKRTPLGRLMVAHWHCCGPDAENVSFPVNGVYITPSATA